MMDVSRLLHNFEKFRAFSELIGNVPSEVEKRLEQQIRIDDEGYLVLTPSIGKPATWAYPRMLALPIDIELDISSFEEGILNLQFNVGTSMLIVALHGEMSPTENVGTVTVGWRSTPKELIQSLSKVSPENDETIRDRV